MQKDVIVHSFKAGDQPPTYPPIEKNIALKMLNEYRQDMGWGWTKIRNQIVSTCAPHATEQSPLLTRQDLESWHQRKNDIGGQKFQLVRDFILSEQMRDKFPGRHRLYLYPKERISRHFRPVREYQNWYAGFVDKNKNRPIVSDLKESPQIAAHNFSKALCGLYTAEHNSYGGAIYIYCGDSWQDIFFQLLSWRSYPRGEIADWEMDRLTGPLIIGEQCTVLGKDITNPDIFYRILIANISLNEDKSTASNFSMFFARDLENRIHSKTEGTSKSDLYPMSIKPMAVDLGQWTVDFERSEDRNMINFVEKLLWNIVL